MKTQALGTTDLRIPAIAFGCNVLGWTMDQKQSFKVLDRLYELGFNYMDTADVYSRWVDGHQGGESEKVLGSWMKERGRRDRMIVATKVGMDVGQGKVSLAPEHINQQIEKSLRHLQTDYVDVYFSHRHDPDTPIDVVLDTYSKLIDQGKVRHIGSSSFPLDVFKESIATAQKEGLPLYQIYQPEYSLIHRADFENGYQDYVLKNDIAVTSYWALANGFLTGKYQNVDEVKGSSREGNLEKYFTDRGKQILETLGELSKEMKVSQAAISIAWTMAQPGITAPIVSATKISQLDAFLEAVEVEFTQEHLNRLQEL